MDDLETYYGLLEIPETATEKEAKSAFDRLAFQYHPDRLGQVPEHLTKLRQDAAEKWLQIQQAWSVIRDPEKRRQYRQCTLQTRRS